MTQKVRIIYEDKDLVVCHKMPCIPVQTARAGQQDMVSLLRNYFAGKGQDTQIFIVHRLDQPVEGVMVFARNKRAANALSSQFRERKTQKYYLALVEGQFEESSGILEDYLLRDAKSNTSRVVTPKTQGARYARLSYEVKRVSKAEELMNQNNNNKQKNQSVDLIQSGSGVSLVEIHLETGRHHQIRVQMAHAGHPLLGDKKYAPNCGQGYVPIGLCAVKIAFMHPITRKDMEFTVKPRGELFSCGNFGI